MSDDSARLCLIPARGGSVGVPGKNIRLLGGVPLVAHTIRSARASELFSEVYLSTDDPQIAAVATHHGATTIPRPDALAEHDTPMARVVEHALEWCEQHRKVRPRQIFLLEPTSPFRSAGDIQHAASLLDSDDCDAAMGVFEADMPRQWGLRANSQGMLTPVGELSDYQSRRQDLPPTYFPGPVFAIETEAFLATGGFLGERTRFFVVSRQRALDIDTDLDFLFAEFLLGRSNEIGPDGT
jgi:CMP-N,N'-diacetyllegionaminic acid synthase